MPYGLGVAVAAGARFLLEYRLFVHTCGSLACYPIDFLQFSGWDIILGHYLMEMSGAVGGLLGLVGAARLAPRLSCGLPLVQGIIVILAPFVVRNPSGYSLVIHIGVWASAGAVATLLALGLYIAGTVVVRGGTAIYRWTLRAFADDVIE